jgi:hypothetical protein
MTVAHRAEPGAGPSEMTLRNRLPADHPQRLALQAAVAKALSGLNGPWDVVIEAQGLLTLVIGVVAPDGSSWTMSCCNPRDRDPESIAETVRAACTRRSVRRGIRL